MIEGKIKLNPITQNLEIIDMKKVIDLNQNELMIALTALQHQKTFLDKWLQGHEFYGSRNRSMIDETAGENMRLTLKENCKLQAKLKQALGLEQ